MLRILDQLPFWVVLVLCATFGLAPFSPEPHLWEKLKMLAAGDLVKPIDWFDLGLHGLPWLLMAAKGLRVLSQKTR
ncbi:RND transporter [Roseovarius sp.]|jgi:hypothetical protein